MLSTSPNSSVCAISVAEFSKMRVNIGNIHMALTLCSMTFHVLIPILTTSTMQMLLPHNANDETEARIKGFARGIQLSGATKIRTEQIGSRITAPF